MSNPQVQSLTVNGTTYDIVDNTSGYMTGMTILSYGNSTWQDFIDAYTAKKVVYCRASSQSNPATGSQTRLAFMACVNNVESPTEVEFQYYRSVSSKTESQQGDQVFIYTLTSSGSWSVITREASVKVAVGGDLNGSYSGGTYTISADIPDQNVISVDQKVTTGVNIADITINGVITELYAPQGGGSSGTITRVKTTAGAHTAIDVSSGSASFNIPTNTSHLVNDSGFITSYTDTKNTAGSTNLDSKLYLIGATSQAANPQTYSNVGLYFDNGINSETSVTSGCQSYISQDSGSILLGISNNSDEYNISIDWNEGITIDGVVTPTENSHAANKKYVDDSINAISIPTKTSDLTNDSGFITSYTDEKLKWTASTSTDTFYPLQSNSSATTSTANTLNGISVYQYYNIAGGYRRLNLGNSTAYKSTGGAYGTIRLYGSAATYYGDLVPGVLGTTSGDGHISANRTWTLPDKTGTVALTSDIPTKTSDLTNDSGFITGYTETDPTVPSWAKASTKPAYTASEVGAQAILVSGTNIKTINNKSLLGSGNISIVNEAEEFTGTRSNAIYRGECFGTYDPNSNSVTLIYHFYHNSDIPTSYTLFTIPQKYRPTTTKYGGAFYTVGSSWIAYNGYVTSGGIVKQDVSGQCRSGFGVIKYILN